MTFVRRSRQTLVSSIKFTVRPVRRLAEWLAVSRVWDWLCSTTAKRSPTFRRVRLSLEQLECREMLSASITALSSSENPALYGDNISFSVLVSGTGATPSGTVDFQIDSTTVDTETLDGTGAASFNTSSVNVGSHSVVAVYSGDSNNDPSDSDTLTQSVYYPTSTSLSSSETPGVYGDDITFTANVSSPLGIPSGSVEFWDATTDLGTATLDSSGNASLDVSSLSAGGHSISAVYDGDSLNLGSASSTLDQLVYYQTSTSLTASENPGAFGDNITLSVNVSSPYGIPTGAVDFWVDGSTNLGSGALDTSGNAIFNVSTLSLGDHGVTAVYGGDPYYVFSTSSGLDLPIDERPALTAIANKTAVAGIAISLQVVSTDPNSDPLNFDATGLPSGLSISTDGLISGNIDTSAVGANAVTVSVTDTTTGLSANESFTWTVTPPFTQATVTLTRYDLSATGVGPDWGQTRSWSNATGYPMGSDNGNGWVDSQNPHLIEANDLSTLAVIGDSQSAWFFDQQSDGSYLQELAGPQTFTFNSSVDTYTFVDGAGNQFTFDGFSSAWPTAQQGQFASMTNPAGMSAAVNAWTTSGQIAEIQESANGITNSYLFSYVLSGANVGLLESVVLRRSTDSGATWATVQQVAYAYFDGTQAGGSVRDLMTTTTKDSAGNPILTDYYRYYAAGATGGYSTGDGLKFVVEGPAYARLKAAAGGTDADVLAASDSLVAAYANTKYVYDSSARVATEVVAGAGNSGGQGTFTYSYTTSTNSPDVNYWQLKTTETQPDGTQNITYRNAFGDVLLTDHHENSQDWITYNNYDDNGNLLLQASPSSVTSYNDSYADLHISDSAGLITSYAYYSSTTATTTTAGGVAGNLESVSLQNGASGTPVPQELRTYIGYTDSSGNTSYQIAADTVYRNDDGSGAITTNNSYSFSSTTGQVQSATITLPVVGTTQNGPGGSSGASVTTVYNAKGQLIWTKAAGFLNYTAYDAATGAVVKQINDVNTSLTSEFTGLPSGWTTPSGGGLNQVTTFQVDALGRTTEETDPNGNITYVVYIDASHEVRVYPGWNSTTHTTTGPSQVYRQDWANGYTESLTMTATPALDSSNHPTGTESIGGVVSLSRIFVNAAGQTTESDAYFNLSGLTYSTSTSLGTVNTNYYATTFGYDANGLLNREVSPSGTIYRTVRDGQGRQVSTWVGVNDTPISGTWSPSNAAGMVETEADVYDNGGVGDGNLTQRTLFTHSSSNPDRVSQYAYDWRDRLVAEKDGVQTTESTSVNRPITIFTYNNLNQVTKTQVYDGDGIALTNAISTFQSTNAGLLRAQSETYYDDLGQVYRTQADSVNPTTGTVGSNPLTTNIYRDSRGNIIERTSPSAPVTKTTYNGLGHVTVQFTTDGAGGASYSAASSVASDTVLSQTEFTYDANQNVIQTTTRDRLPTASGTGTLGTATSGVAARVTYAGAYYDPRNRLTATVNVGDNGGTSWTRPSSVPSRSSTALVTSYGFDSAGNRSDITDPNGIVTHSTFNAFGQPTETIEDYSTSSGHINKTTDFTYGPAGMTSLTVLQPGGTNQTTAWVYGVTTSSGSAINSNDIVGATEYPDPTTGAASSSQKETVTLDALDQVLTRTDRNGNVHTYSYDALGREISDAVTTLGSGVNGSIRRVETAYDGQGNPYLITSYSAASGGSIVNQVLRQFNGFGQITREYQSTSGAVNTSTTPSVQYTYSEAASGNNSRLTSIIYPDGHTVYYNYASGVADTISRLTSLSDSTGTLESYTFLGANNVIGRSYSQPGLNQVSTLDQFGRIAELKSTVSTTTVSDDQYKYDANSNVLSKNDAVNTALGQVFAYDNLNQITSFGEGTLNSGHTAVSGTASQSQSWSFDQLGNWNSVTTNGSTQTRTANAQNEYTAVSGATTPTYDNNGNTTKDQAGLQYVYDAWNRVVGVKDSSGTTLETFSYDGLDRRITITAGGSTTNLFYSNQWQVLEESTSSGYTNRYVWSPVYVNALILRDSLVTTGATSRLWVIQDANWNVVALVNGSGTVVERYDYTPFGVQTVLNANGTVKTGGTGYNWLYGFQGGRLDSVTGNYSFQMRDYDPVSGRWKTMDPMGFAAGDQNRYRMEGNGPVEGLDPHGLSMLGRGARALWDETRLVGGYVLNNPVSAYSEYTQGVASGANQMFVQPVVRTAQFAYDVPNALYDSNYQPLNPAFRAYLNNEIGYGEAWLSITSDSVATLLTFTGLNGLRALRSGSGATSVGFRTQRPPANQNTSAPRNADPNPYPRGPSTPNVSSNQPGISNSSGPGPAGTPASPRPAASPPPAPVSSPPAPVSPPPAPTALPVPGTPPLSPLEREAVDLATEMIEQRAIIAEQEVVIQEIKGRLAAGEDLDPEFVRIVYELQNSVVAQYARNQDVIDVLLGLITKAP